ncbi:hypothetical protein DE146DRAFT_611501 [Phaeosphaeria sp. MPI-PUGE-AT-0046c]|nr:hypothetical protein DE146DRAFT_611501 [Phaeosphaeria sp. MPI-PUGE-AT-0046c]
MSKGNSDGDVLANKLSLGLANRQKLLASLMGPPADASAASETSKNEEEDAELEHINFGHDRLGVGGILPKDVADGTFMRRSTTSNDKLLEQLIGKKRAKAHLAAKQQTERAGSQQVPKPGRRPVPKKEESDDEEEGRAATFKSKRRKVGQSKKAPSSEDEVNDGAADHPTVEDPEEGLEQENAPKILDDVDEGSDAAPVKAKPKSLPSRGRAKPTSYLDEILAERSKKKKNKSKNKAAAET